MAVEDPLCDVPQAAADRLGYLLVALGINVGELAAGRLAELGIDEVGYSVLAILTVDGPGSQHEISQLLGKAPGLVVAIVDQLEAKGFVERQRDPADRRRSRVTPTATGSQVLAKADAMADALVAEVLAGLDASEVDQLHGLLRRGLRLTSLKDV